MRRKTLWSDEVDNARPRFHWVRPARKFWSELAAYHGCSCEGVGTVREGDRLMLCECRQHGPSAAMKREAVKASRRKNRKPEYIPTMAEIWDVLTMRKRG